MHTFFQENPFQANAASDLENDAKLALHLVLFLLSAQSPEDGTWRGVDIGSTLRNTCHSLEALHLLGWEVSARAIETGLAWLINLPDVFDLSAEEEDSIRLYPSRFKTLAWLEEFSDPQVISDFEALEEHLDDDGLLRGVMINQLLGTMVYIDCLDYLEKLAPLPVLSSEKRERAIHLIEQNILLWYQDLQQKTQRSLIETVGDLSYAIDLLLRDHRSSIQTKIDRDGLVAALMSGLELSESSGPISSDTLYCAIQLATHFPASIEAREAVQRLIRRLRTRYENLDLRKEPPFFHPLVLRVLLTFYGEQLKAEMTRLLLEREREHLELRRQSVERGLRDDFQSLIKNRFEVEISEVQPLTGGFTRARVFRVHFLLKFASMSEGNELQLNTYQPNPGSLVIKSDSLESLRRSMQRYRSLPEGLKPYFAKHSRETQILKSAGEGPCYLIMEDLTHMQTFQDLIARIDQGRLSPIQKRDLQLACTTISDSLFAIYDQTRRDDTDFFGSQLSRLYMSGIEQNLIRMCRPDKFPHLKDWLRGFWLGERKYRSIEYYLRKLESHKAKLKVPYLMLTHGDCHSRNIMLDSRLRQCRLIDLDRLENDGDYIKDFALLIEDVCVFRFLFDEGYRLYLGTGAGRFVSHVTEPKLIENKIEYPPFSSEATRLLQQHLLGRLQDYARRTDDERWQERLWLALASYLIFLVTKQPDKGLATVVYVEAVKLLDDLVSHLDNETELAEIPFPGKHPPGVEHEFGQDDLSLPAWYRVNPVLTNVHDEIIAFDPTVKCELSSSDRVVQYFATNPQRPFAVINGKKPPPSVLLACSPTALDDPSNLTQARSTNSAFQTLLQINSAKDGAAAVKLIRQAFDQNLESSAIPK